MIWIKFDNSPQNHCMVDKEHDSLFPLTEVEVVQE